MWFFDVFHFLYNTKMYRFCNGQISAPCHRNSEHRRIGLIGWILIQMSEFYQILDSYLTYLLYYIYALQSYKVLYSTIRNHSFNSFIIFLSIIITIHPISPIRLCSDFWWKGALFWPLRNLYVLVLYKKWKTSKNHIFFSSYAKKLLICHFYWSNDEWASS